VLENLLRVMGAHVDVEAALPALELPAQHQVLSLLGVGGSAELLEDAEAEGLEELVE